MFYTYYMCFLTVLHLTKSPEWVFIHIYQDVWITIVWFIIRSVTKFLEEKQMVFYFWKKYVPSLIVSASAFSHPTEVASKSCYLK